MPVFLVTYDLVGEDSGDDYGPLWDRLKELNAVRFQLSSWLVYLENAQRDVHDHLNKYIDENDRLMVVLITQRPSWRTAFKGTKAFIDQHFPT